MKVSVLNCKGAEDCVRRLRTEIAQTVPDKRGEAWELLNQLEGFITAARELAKEHGIPTEEAR